MLLHFEEIALIHHAVNDVFHVVGLIGLGGHDLIECFSARSMGSVQGLRGGSSRLFEGMKAQQLAHHRQAFGIVMRLKVRDAGSFIVGVRAADSSLVTSSCVTVLITSGPVMNM